MTTDLRFRALHAGPIATITDVRCRARDGVRGAEELSPCDEVVFPRTGAFVKHLGPASFLADPGHVVFFNGGEPYRVSHPVAGGDASTVFAFPRNTLAEAFGGGEPDGSRWRFPLTHCPVGPAVSLALQGLRRHLDPGWRHSGLVADTLSLDLLRAVAREVRRRNGIKRPVRRHETRRRRGALVEAARVLLSRTYRGSPSLAAIASEVGVSPFHLTRIFREETGTPLHRYRGLLRLREALERLAGGENDLTSLALDLGYSSHSHFTDSFRATFGMSPSAFRIRPSSPPLRALRKILEA